MGSKVKTVCLTNLFVNNIIKKTRLRSHYVLEQSHIMTVFIIFYNKISQYKNNVVRFPSLPRQRLDIMEVQLTPLALL